MRRLPVQCQSCSHKTLPMPFKSGQTLFIDATNLEAFTQCHIHMFRRLSMSLIPIHFWLRHHYSWRHSLMFVRAPDVWPVLEQRLMRLH